MKTHSFSATERYFLIFHSICFLAALLFLRQGMFWICLLFILLLGLSLPLFLLTGTHSSRSGDSAYSPETDPFSEEEQQEAAEKTPLPATETEPLSDSDPAAPHLQRSGKAVMNEDIDPDLLSVLPLREEGPVSLNLSAVCETMAKDLAALYGLFPSQLRIQSGEETIFFTTYRAPLMLALQNLMDNGIKYAKHDSPRGARFSLTLSRQGSDILLIFRNNTCGIPQSETAGLTDLNRQGPNRISGTGLGLFQARAAVSALQGSLEIKSSPGTGFAVYLRLPDLSDALWPEDYPSRKEASDETT